MKRYQLRITKRVKQQIDKLPGRYRQRIKTIIEELPTDPYPSGAKLLRERYNMYRLRLDDYRIVWSIDDDILTVEVLKVGLKQGPDFYDDM